MGKFIPIFQGKIVFSPSRVDRSSTGNRFFTDLSTTEDKDTLPQNVAI
jgi:hypothetical protein